MGLSNDDRGWVMTGLSGVACIFGASFICIDLIVRLFPGQRNWDIKHSDTFLSVSLSLSFGVMLFSALYSMLPSSKKSLESGGLSSSNASWVMIACFLGGVIGIQIVSRVMHHYVPHHAVGCEHSHEDEEAHKEGAHAPAREHEEAQHDSHSHARPSVPTRSRSAAPAQPTRPKTTQPTSARHDHHQTATGLDPDSSMERPPLPKQISMTLTKFTSGKDPSCACDGPCFGYSDPCTTQCFKNVNTTGGFKAPKPTTGVSRPSAIKNATATESTPLLHNISEESLARPHTRAVTENADLHPSDFDHDHGLSSASSTTAVTATGSNDLHKTHSHQSTHSHSSDELSPEASTHHHHVPTNAFLSIGLQTSIAIALHKLPEGFITYATNHANPKLGVSVFLALFIHNITEGFAMALPLYLAINSRLKAMLVSFVLGGLSQPLGAGVAALWFRLAGRSGWQPNEVGYGAMFAVTAGILASVALQLFAESLDLTHSKHLCMIGAFCGMGILGISSALTA